MRSSKGRHGGGGGRTDKGEAMNQRRQAGVNTAVDSMAKNRNESRGGGKKT
jgi:hypothetical protein